jgi:nucleoside-diphosphate-sugar epimerase
MARILIAGCGDIGAGAGRLLAEDGHEVVGLKRHPPDNDEKISYIRADVARVEDCQNLDTRFDLVIYILTPDDRSEARYRNVFEHGVANMLAVFKRNNADARFLFVSSTSVYGQSHGEWVDEESETNPQSVTGRIILQAENAILSAGSKNCVIRFSGIYGRSKSRLLDTVIKGGEVQYKPPYYTNRIYRGDCIGVLHFIAGKMLAGVRLDSIYLASDDDPAPKWDVYNFLAGKMGVARPEKQTLPTGSEQNKRCSNERLKRLGYRFTYKSYREGYDYIKPFDS